MARNYFANPRRDFGVGSLFSFVRMFVRSSSLVLVGFPGRDVAAGRDVDFTLDAGKRQGKGGQIICVVCCDFCSAAGVNMRASGPMPLPFLVGGAPVGD